MEGMKRMDTRPLRHSLALVWLGTALVSVLDWPGGVALLRTGGVQSALWAHALIAGGAALDLIVGLLLWLRPGRWSYGLALALMLLMTVVATALLPGLWLHPLGPLLKNLPIAAALLFLLKEETP